MTQQVFQNAQIVLADQLIQGDVVCQDGLIQDIHETGTLSAAVKSGSYDLQGDYLMPGFVELHTDNLERHMTPRPKTEWPILPAVIAHDAQIASAGITTVFDAISVGDVADQSARVTRLMETMSGLSEASAAQMLRIDHKVHLRCEVSYPKLQTALETLLTHPLVQMLSVMDHTPGQRQFTSVDVYCTYYQGKYGYSDAQMQEFIEKRYDDQRLYSQKHRDYVVKMAAEHNYALASHDDATAAHVAEAVKDKMTVAEFPTTVEAAKASHEAGLGVMMGGPNLVRGGSHSGNVSAQLLAEHGYLDIISSDYIPHSMIQGAFLLAQKVDQYDLPKAIACISKTPAQDVGLTDRGEIAIGKRADLVHVGEKMNQALVNAVWVQGKRVI